MSDPTKDVKVTELPSGAKCARCKKIHHLKDFCDICSEVIHVTEAGDKVWQELICFECCYHEEFDENEPDLIDLERERLYRLQRLDRKCERWDM
mgnify:CR=1 FL=1